MDPTTLVTFLFRAPPEVRTVELLGSWDNFSRPYYMHHDKRRGHGFWSGCFNFKDIVFDGDKAHWAKPRSGGLKQGGTYWYFYRLNDAVEAFDDSQCYTTGCPLLPGQTVNVIDVPVEVEDLPSRPQSSTVDVAGPLARARSTHTLDPQDKWAKLEPPPMSKVHERCISDLALNGRLETKPHSYRDVSASPPVSPVTARSQLSLAVPRGHSAHDARSIRSRNGWSSSPPSRESSIYEAFEQGAERASLSAFPLPGVYRSDKRPTTRDGGNADHGFDFAFDTASSRRSVRSRTSDDDLDGSSFVFEPCVSRPQSAYGSVDGRFTVAPADFQRSDDRPERETDDETHPPPERSHSNPESLHHHRQSEDSTASASASGTPFDLCSPTFSAATISSNGGLNTPFRLSAGYNTTRSSAPHSANQAHFNQNGDDDDDGRDSSIEHITARLRLLGSEDSAGSLPTQGSDDVEAPKRTFVGHYALPLHDDASATTLGKMSSGHASVVQHQHSLPPLPTTTTVQVSSGLGGDSFADAIFSELGYLGGSIA